jgi:hypothetical protein
MYKIKPLLLAAFLMLLCCNSNANSIAEQLIKDNELTKNKLQQHIEFLADDSLKGRNTGTQEYEVAAQYVARHFEQYELKPAMKNGSWFQSVPFIESTLTPSATQMILHSGDSQQVLNYHEEFFSFPSAISPQDTVKAPLVFVGYGISSEELYHDDYNNIDVTGSIVVFITGRPSEFPSEAGAHVSDFREKIKQAALHGAVGVIAIDSPNNQTYMNLRDKAAQPFLKWQQPDGSVFGEFVNLRGVSLVTSRAGEKIFSAAKRKLSDIYADIANKQIPASFNLDISATLTRSSKFKKLFSSNILGVLEGSDPLLKNEYVVLSAHLDHIGAETENTAQKTDIINNGALDNASGIAVMLETARRLSEGTRPKRSILFVAVTAEEQGLLGSNYLAHNPPVPLPSMVANVNLDMVAMLYPFADVIAFGAEHSSLKEAVSVAALNNEVLLSPDPMPDEAVFVRSDHYSFVKQGIPSIYLMVGFGSKNPKINGASVFMEFFSNHYHKPTDDTSLQINYDAGAVFTNISIDTTETIANKKEAPRWHKNSFFGKAFKKYKAP